MNKWTQFLIAAGSVVAAANAQAAAIFVLGDNYSETFISPYLESLGHTVTSDTNYYDWDGSMPADIDVILYLDGYEYGSALGEYGDSVAANQSILDFVAGGGGLIFTEWYAYDRKDVIEEPVAALMPVTYNGNYYYEAAWNASAGYEDHDLVNGLLSSSFSEGNGDNDTYSDVIANDGTIVVMEDGAGIPLLSYSNVNGGTVVHINDGMAYDDTISDEMLSVIASSVAFAAKDSVPVPEPGSLGIIGLGLAAMGLSRRKKKKQ
ncbi:MAG: PEP-CTERM sorting domain-containing protein [Colwellia sp.]|nr:PEP-CTERM sorting domain-containing protein [Colwellia sp.]